MYGYYRLEDTDAMDSVVKELNLYENWDAMCVVNEGGEDIMYDRLLWYIDPVDGKLVLEIEYDNKLKFDYFYSGDKLILRDYYGYSYILVKGIDPYGN